MDQQSKYTIGLGDQLAPQPNNYDSLRTRIGQLHRRVRRLVWIRAIAWLVMILLGIMLSAVALDWWLRPSGWWGRGALTLGTIGGCLAACGWFWWSTWRRPLSLMAVARRLESILPGMGDRLSSAVALIEQVEQKANAGNRQDDLTTAAVNQVHDEFAAANPEAKIDRWPAIRGVLMASLLMAVSLFVMLWNPEIGSLTARRIFSPTAEAAWPRRNHLVLQPLPDRVHIGSQLQVFVSDRLGPLPEDTEILFRLADGRIESPPLRMVGEAGTSVWPEVRQNLAVRARGGDDDTMPWQDIEVTSAPLIESLEIRLQPPAYTGLPEVTVTDPQLRVLAGTTLWLQATLSQPLQSGKLQLSSATTQWPSELPLELSPAGTELELGPLLLEESFSGQFVWLDRQGIEGQARQRLQVQVEPDSAPLVMLTQPPADQEVTPLATLELSAQFEDDLGLQTSWLETRHLRSATTVEQQRRQYSENELRATISWERPLANWFPSSSPASAQPATTPNVGEDSAAVDAAVDATVEGGVQLQIGDVIEVTAIAIDTAGNRGQSTTRRLRVIDNATMQSKIAAAEGRALEQLREARQQQQLALEQSEATKARLGTDEASRQAAADRLQAASSSQRNTQQRLSEGPDSALELLQRASDLAEANQVDAEQVNGLRDQVEQLATRSEQGARQSLRQSAEALADQQIDEASQALAAATEAQRDNLQQLNQLMAKLQQADAQRAAGEQLGELSAAQQRMIDETRSMHQANDRGQEEERLSARQRELARQTAALQDQLRELATALQADDPTAAEAAAQAAETLQPDATQPDATQPDATRDLSAVAELMRQAAEQLERGREGSAEELQQQALDQVNQARRELAGQRSGQPGQPQSQEPAAASEQLAASVRALRASQAGLVARWRRDEPPQLATDQNQIAADTNQLATATSEPPGFPETLGDAAADMRVAAQLLQRGEPTAVSLDAATAALQRLDLVLESLDSATDTSEKSAPAEGGEPTPEEPDAEAEENKKMLASLRLARATQAFLKTRTMELMQAIEEATEKSTDPAIKARYEVAKRKLAEEQQRLIDRIESYEELLRSR